MPELNHIQFHNEFVSTFPGDDSGNTQPRQTPGKMFSKAMPTIVSHPELLAWSADLAAQLGIDKPVTQEEVNVLGGNLVTGSMYPYAACYAGHQFGNWAGQLGDGRAITLGELTAADGSSWELQLKGAGPTAYSRRADGRAVLRSSVREYLMSEAMFHLGVPTTRALSLVSTGDEVLRDMFYNGNAAYEPGAIVARTAPSFLRFGNFEMLAARSETANLQSLVDWTIAKYYPHISGQDKIMQWFREITERTADLMVHWMRVGFVHGVMNTDNMSILGLTIDYGPYSFVDDYDLNFTPNTTDLPGRRYAFGRQPVIGQWNLGCLAGAIAPLLDGTEELQAVLEAYEDIYYRKYQAMMANKLGLDEPGATNQALIDQCEAMLSVVKPDMTMFFQLLIDLPAASSGEGAILDYFKDSFYQAPTTAQAAALTRFVEDYRQRITLNSITAAESAARMRATNPRFILRNYLLHQAIEGLENGDDTLFVTLQQAIREPYGHGFDQFFARRPQWASQKAGCSMLSCSS